LNESRPPPIYFPTIENHTNEVSSHDLPCIRRSYCCNARPRHIRINEVLIDNPGGENNFYNFVELISDTGGVESAEKAGFQARDVLVEADGGELIDLVALIKWIF